MRRLAHTLGCILVCNSATFAAPVGSDGVEPITWTIGWALIVISNLARPALCSRGRSQWARSKGGGE